MTQSVELTAHIPIQCNVEPLQVPCVVLLRVQRPRIPSYVIYFRQYLLYVTSND
jgi:hypothetical protein